MKARSLATHLIHLVKILIAMITILFIGLTLIKGNPITLFSDPRLGEGQIQALKEMYGYDRSSLEQYITYLGNILRGDLGHSFTFKRPVAEIIPGRLNSSMQLGLAVYSSASLISLMLLLGMYRSSNQWVQRVSQQLHLILLSMPSFVLATLLMAVFAVHWRLLPMVGRHDLFAADFTAWQAFWDQVRHAILPTISLALPLAGRLTAYIHEQMQDIEKAPYILSARGRGVTEGRIFWNHKLRVLLPDLIQWAGLYLPTIAGGTLIIESIFGWTGMGMMLFDAVSERDYPLLLGGTISVTLFVVCGYELADYLREQLQTREQA